MSKSLYLNTTQYYELLLKIRETITQPGFVVECDDSETIGNKYTTSNCGLCNDEFTTLETALFPDQFPARKEMKYREKDKNHHCPFDDRIMGTPTPLEACQGCFFTCYLFNHKKHDPEHMLTRVNMLIEITKERIPPRAAVEV